MPLHGSDFIKDGATLSLIDPMHFLNFVERSTESEADQAIYHSSLQSVFEPHHENSLVKKACSLCRGSTLTGGEST